MKYDLSKPFVVTDDSPQDPKPLAFVWPEDVSGGFIADEDLLINTKSGGLLRLTFGTAVAAKQALDILMGLTIEARRKKYEFDNNPRILGTNGHTYESDVEIEVVGGNPATEDDGDETPMVRIRCLRETCNWIGDPTPKQDGKGNDPRCQKCGGSTWAERTKK